MFMILSNKLLESSSSKTIPKINWQLLNLFWLDYCSSVVTCERSSHVKTIILWYLLLGRIDYTIGLRMFIVPYIHLVIVVVTHFGGSRHWANPCTFRGIWRRIRCSGHPGERCPRVDPRIRSSKSGKRPSTAGNCAESCWISGRSVPAAFSCTRAFSIRWTKRWNKQQQRRYDCIERRETESCPSSSCPCVSFLLYSYQFFVVECGSRQNWRQSGIAFRRRHRLKYLANGHGQHYTYCYMRDGMATSFISCPSITNREIMYVMHYV